ETRVAVRPVCGRLQHLRWEQSGGGAGDDQSARLDRPEVAAGSQREEKWSGATVGTQVPRVHADGGTADHDRGEQPCEVRGSSASEVGCAATVDQPAT